MEWKALHPQATAEHLGYLPGFLSEADPRPAREQINANYAHGGGWSPFKGFTMDAEWRMHYPGDPPTLPLAECQLREERIIFYQHAWVAIVQPDGTFEVSRID